MWLDQPPTPCQFSISSIISGSFTKEENHKTPMLLPHPNPFAYLVLLKFKAKDKKYLFFPGQKELEINLELFIQRRHLTNAG
jgi:hypothetical protein